MEPTKSAVPHHIGIIMDGNRRFSKKLMMKPWKGHEWGAKKVQDVLEWCREYHIKELTLYAFSYENFNRPKEEFDFLMNLFLSEFERMKNDTAIDEYQIRIHFIGRLSLFPDKVRIIMQELMERTKDHQGFILNVAMAYSGRMEVIDAAKKIAEHVQQGKLSVEDINEEVFEKNLYMADEPDLIIRTGGERRLSNFLNYQSSYSELFFLEKFWPEFEKEDFVSILTEYGKRERRFGL